MKETISAHQTAILASILVFANKILTLPSLLFEYGKGDSIFMILIMFLIDLLFLKVFFMLKKKFKTESFFQVLEMGVGKWITVFIYVLIFCYFMLTLLLNFNVTHLYFNMEVYHNDQKTLFLFVFLFILAVTSFKGLRGICRTIEFFYIPIIIGFLLCLFISCTNYKHCLTFFDADAIKFFLGIYKYIFVFGDFFLLFLIMDKIEIKEKSEQKIFKYVLLAMGIILAEYFLFFSIFHYTAFMHTNALSDIIGLSYEIFDIGRLDLIAVVTVMTNTFCQVAVWGYILTEIMQKIFPLMPKSYAIGVIIIIFLLCYTLLLNSLESLIFLITVVMPIPAILLQYVLPFCSLLIKKRGDNEDPN